MKTETKIKIWKIVLILFIILLLCLAIYLPLKLTGSLDKINNTEDLKEIIVNSGIYGFIIFFIIQFVQVTILPIPAAVTTIAGTLVFGPWITLIISFISIMAASIFSFFIGRKIGRKIVVWAIGEEDTIKWSNILEKGKYTFFLAMLFPVFPDDILCLVVGATTSMSYKFFIITNLITRPIGIFSLCFLSSGLLIPFSGWGIPVWIGLFIICAILFYISIRYQSKIENFVIKLSQKLNIKTDKQKNSLDIESTETQTNKDIDAAETTTSTSDN